MQQNQFLLYGANGYTGQLIARHARDYGLEPILAGRSTQALTGRKEVLRQLVLDFVAEDIMRIRCCTEVLTLTAR